MAEPATVAIQKALTDRLIAYANSLNPVIAISYPNVAFTPPAAKSGTPVVYGKYLDCHFLPVPSFATGIAWNAHAQHYGVFMVKAFIGIGAGDPAARRIAEAIASWFKRGTVVSQDGFKTTIYETPSISDGMVDDVWWSIPISIPYKCFARPA